MEELSKSCCTTGGGVGWSGTLVISGPRLCEQVCFLTSDHLGREEGNTSMNGSPGSLSPIWQQGDSDLVLTSRIILSSKGEIVLNRE